MRLSEINSDEEEDVISEYDVRRDDEDLEQIPKRAYGCIVQGNKISQQMSAKGEKLTKTMREDTRCAIDLARIPTIRAIASDRHVPPMN